MNGRALVWLRAWLETERAVIVGVWNAGLRRLSRQGTGAVLS